MEKHDGDFAVRSQLALSLLIIAADSLLLTHSPPGIITQSVNKSVDDDVEISMHVHTAAAGSSPFLPLHHPAISSSPSSITFPAIIIITITFLLPLLPTSYHRPPAPSGYHERKFIDGSADLLNNRPIVVNKAETGQKKEK